MYEIAKRWYSQDYVLYNILKSTPNREIVGITKEGGNQFVVRPFSAPSLQSLRCVLDFIGAERKPYNLFASEAIVSMPDIKFDKHWIGIKGARELLGKGAGKEWDSRTSGYDFVVEFDSKDIRKSWNDTENLIDYLSNFELPFSIRYSGSKGFHINMGDRMHDIPNKEQRHHPWLYFKRIAKRIKEKFRLRTMDLPYDRRRVMRIPYTLNCTKLPKQLHVCFPLTIDEFIGFSDKQYTPENVLNNVKLFKRGIPITSEQNSGKRPFRDMVSSLGGL